MGLPLYPPTNVVAALNIITPPQVVAVGSSSNYSAAVQAATQHVRITSTVDCWVKLGTGNPVAVANTAGSFFLPASCPMDLIVTGGATQLGVISNTSGTGYLSIIESN